MLAQFAEGFEIIDVKDHQAIEKTPTTQVKSAP